MNPQTVIDMGQQALIVTMVVSGPMLIVGLVVGVVIGIFQAVTQIHEMTLTFIPKILAMIGVMILLMPWMLAQMTDYTIAVFNQIGMIAR
jgi:flagellar biosynthetic protein FliQ